MPRIRLTIGMPVYDDFHGAYMTLQALRLYHDLSEVELLVVDNKPDSIGSPDLKRLVERCNSLTAGARYVEFPDSVGPAGAKNKVFEEARGEAVLCGDSHILFVPGSIAKTLAYLESHPNSRDLYQGPLLLDDFRTVQTHFNDYWRGEMWGIWGVAWHNPHRNENFSVLDHNGRAMFVPMVIDGNPLTDGYPDIPYVGHEPALEAMGCRPLGYDDSDEFDIPGQGCGVLMCRRDAWAGFNPAFHGFGGEEMYIQEKFRQRGDRAICLGFLKWVHRFMRPGGAPYSNPLWHRVYNYVVGHRELGRDLAPIRKHFVEHGRMHAREYDLIVSGEKIPLGVQPAAPTPAKPCCKKEGGCNKNDREQLKGLYDETKSGPGYFTEHLDTIRSLASQCQVVEEISRSPETSVAILAAHVPVVRSYLYGPAARAPIYDDLRESLVAIKTREMSWTTTVAETFKRPEIQHCEMLVYKTDHAYHDLEADLEHYAPKVRRWIVLHDTHRNGDRLDDGGTGYMHAIRDFIAKAPEWFVVRHDTNQCGLTVLGKLPEDKPEKPIKPWPPAYGPGSALGDILKSLGINPSPSCGCRSKARQMDHWGIAGCAKNFDLIVHWMREGQAAWGWKDRIAAGAKAVASGLAFKINWLDPWPGMITEAIRMAAEKLGEWVPEIEHNGVERARVVKPSELTAELASKVQYTANGVAYVREKIDLSKIDPAAHQLAQQHSEGA